ncbi:MAG TPA: hypothetical protein VMS99_01455 [Acidimicrobiia bacterium]|nr:hypothetical protein [Acidimicrobiia bacterium]
MDELLIEVGQLRVVAYGILINVLFLLVPRRVMPTPGDSWRRRRPPKSSTSSGEDTTPMTGVARNGQGLGPIPSRSPGGR